MAVVGTLPSTPTTTVEGLTFFQRQTQRHCRCVVTTSLTCEFRVFLLRIAHRGAPLESIGGVRKTG
jgi:hypothetical protein